MTKDFDVLNGGSVYIVIPKTEAAEAWVEENVAEDRVAFGRGFGVECRFVQELVEGMIDNGFSVNIIN
jgi:hypothetical protein